MWPSTWPRTSATVGGGRLAQLARAPALHAGGPGFESLTAHFAQPERPPREATRRAFVLTGRQAGTATGSGRTRTVSATSKMSLAGMPARAACSRIFSGLDA